jgi:hypothetical protein
LRIFISLLFCDEHFSGEHGCAVGGVRFIGWVWESVGGDILADGSFGGANGKIRTLTPFSAVSIVASEDPASK